MYSSLSVARATDRTCSYSAAGICNKTLFLLRSTCSSLLLLLMGFPVPTSLSSSSPLPPVKNLKMRALSFCSGDEAGLLCQCFRPCPSHTKLALWKWTPGRVKEPMPTSVRSASCKKACTRSTETLASTRELSVDGSINSGNRNRSKRDREVKAVATSKVWPDKVNAAKVVMLTTSGITVKRVPESACVSTYCRKSAISWSLSLFTLSRIRSSHAWYLMALMPFKSSVVILSRSSLTALTFC